ncbi:MAG TPA: aspartyl protease family protein [Dehalococcoidia bacterium]|nr:aspartyl protease family protein [Dehalococcoidia bacterium]
MVIVTGQIGRNRHELTEVEFLVDTGGFYAAISPGLRNQLGLPPGIPERTQLADGSIVDVEVTFAHLRLDGREGAVGVEVMNVPQPLLGVNALDALGMKVNPVSRELEVVWPFDAPPTITTFLPPSS